MSPSKLYKPWTLWDIRADEYNTRGGQATPLQEMGFAQQVKMKSTIKMKSTQTSVLTAAEDPVLKRARERANAAKEVLDRSVKAEQNEFHTRPKAVERNVSAGWGMAGGESVPSCGVNAWTWSQEDEHRRGGL